MDEIDYSLFKGLHAHIDAISPPQLAGLRLFGVEPVFISSDELKWSLNGLLPRGIDILLDGTRWSICVCNCYNRPIGMLEDHSFHSLRSLVDFLEESLPEIFRKPIEDPFIKQIREWADGEIG